MTERGGGEALASLALTGLASEIADPLATLKAGLELLGGGGDSSELLDIVRRQVARLERVLRHLALAARIECAWAARDEGLEPRADLGACARAAALTARALAPGLAVVVGGEAGLVAAARPASVLRAVRCVLLTATSQGAKARLTLVASRGAVGIRIDLTPRPPFAACEASRVACEAAVAASGGRLLAGRGAIRLLWPAIRTSVTRKRGLRACETPPIDRSS